MDRTGALKTRDELLAEVAALRERVRTLEARAAGPGDIATGYAATGAAAGPGVERGLRESEARFRAMADSAPVMVWVTRPDGYCEYLNRRWYEFTGQTVEEGLGLGWVEAVHPEDRAGAKRAFLEANERSGTFRVEYRLRRQDGAYRWCIDSAAPRFGGAGEFLGYVGSVLDVSELREAEEASRRQALLLDQSRDAAFAWDLDKAEGIVYWNRAAEELYGYTAAEVMGRSSHELLKTIFSLPPETFDSVLDGEGRWEGALQHQTRDGRRLVVESRMQVVREAGGRRLVLETARDVTERKRFEHELRVSRERLELVLGATDLGLWYCDLPFGKLEWNAKVKEHFWLPAEAEVTIERFFARLHAEDRGRTQEAMERAIRDHTRYDTVYRTVSDAGEVRWVRAIGKAFYDVAGKPTRFDGVTMDVTAQKRTEQEFLRAKAELEEAGRAKDHFLAVLSHELRTPLTPVMTVVQTMERDPSLPEELRDSVEMIRRNVTLETRLIDDLLDLTRVSRGKVALSLSPTDVHEKIAQVVSICDSEIRGKRLGLVLGMRARRSVVSADPARLQQVLWNLVKNAVKFTPEGGTIAIRTRDTAEGGVAIEVRDSGIGIEPEGLPRLFNAFEQGGREMTRLFGGLGLGLAISRGLMELHGGRLVAESEGRDRGSAFTMEFPEAEESPREDVSSSDGEGRKGWDRKACRILLVDDHADTLKALSRWLQSSGHGVRTADSVAGALQAAEGEPFDVVISDIGLPDGSGLDLMRQLTARRTVRGIALSGFGMEEDVRRSMEAGFAEHLTKPVDVGELDRVLAKVCGEG